MPERKGWSREQLVIALKLYCEIPFGKMDSRNPEIIRYAKLIDRTASALAMKLTNFASLDPEIRSSGRKGLSSASKADRAIWEEMNADWPHLAREIVEVESALGAKPDIAIDLEDDIANYIGETRTTIIEARIGQHFFRRAVLSAYDFKCCISGLSIPDLLVASHIVPWRTEKANRLNPRNGLCLSSIHDRAFDSGLISISDDFCVVLSNRLRKMKRDPYINNTFCIFEGLPINLPKKFSPDADFLKHHRESLFRG